MSNIFLIGMRGVGKTTIGRLLAERLRRDWGDVDDQIVHREGKSIAEIVGVHGWSYFREKEHQEVLNVTSQNNLVVSTGGGVLMHFNNADLLKASGKIILLLASPEALVQRLRESHQRPSLTGKDPFEEINQVWSERKDIYLKYADIIIETEPWDVDRIVEEIFLSFRPE